MVELTTASLIVIGSAVLSSLATVSPFIWKFSSWKQKTEDRQSNIESRVDNIEALDIGVQLAKINTTLAHIDSSQSRLENAILNKNK